MHDYTLKNIDLDWLAGETRITLLDASSQPLEILATGVTELSVPRHSEWGFSVSVNEAQISESGDKQRLELAMQSGDVLLLEASDIQLP